LISGGKLAMLTKRLVSMLSVCRRGDPRGKRINKPVEIGIGNDRFT